MTAKCSWSQNIKSLEIFLQTEAEYNSNTLPWHNGFRLHFEHEFLGIKIFTKMVNSLCFKKVQQRLFCPIPWRASELMTVKIKTDSSSPPYRCKNWSDWDYFRRYADALWSLDKSPQNHALFQNSKQSVFASRGLKNSSNSWLFQKYLTKQKPFSRNLTPIKTWVKLKFDIA